MRIDSLLEKRERAIYQLLLYLEDRKEAPSLKDICYYLELSKSTLLRYIVSFNEEAEAADLGLSFQLEDEKVFLKKKASLSLHRILAYLCQTSTKYQIIVYLSDKEEVSIQQLAQELLISEATLNRHLASLNQILAEFGIGIKSGRLKGSELQIRYFLHQMLSLTTTRAELQEEFMLGKIEALLPVFERFYQSPLNPKQAHRLLLWLMISQQRSRLRQLDFKPLYKLMEPYQEHKFYRRLRKMYFTLSQQQSTSFQEGEIMALFAFLFSHFILAPHQLEQVLGFGGPIMEATSLALQKLRLYFEENLPVSEEALYHLNQIMSQLYFFYSSVELEEVEASSFYPEAEDLLKDVYKSVFHRKVDKEIRNSYLTNIAGLYIYFGQVQPIQVKVAFASSLHEVLSYPLLLQLREKLEGNRQVLIEPYQAGYDYDLIITDYLENTSVPVYCLGNRLKIQDIVQLKAWIQDIYHQKSCQSEIMATKTSFPIEHR
ncbi:helix-turn-helix domain-containing protein [Streptococcus sp. 2020WUSS089]|uniref:helix-turn-helix domain-containing protein n=1 Tax=Streptococcus sp. 2020WUSS089 TaxID=2983280 RepID=UPI0037CF17D3